MKGLPTTLKLMESVFAVEQIGTRLEVVRRSWRERLLSRPWNPWIATKTIEVPNYAPAIFRVGNTILYHPSLREQLLRSLNHE